MDAFGPAIFDNGLGPEPVLDLTDVAFAQIIYAKPRLAVAAAD
jgi:hypothetical protein